MLNVFLSISSLVFVGWVFCPLIENAHYVSLATMATAVSFIECFSVGCRITQRNRNVPEEKSERDIGKDLSDLEAGPRGRVPKEWM